MVTTQQKQREKSQYSFKIGAGGKLEKVVKENAEKIEKKEVTFSESAKEEVKQIEEAVQDNESMDTDKNTGDAEDDNEEETAETRFVKVLVTKTHKNQEEDDDYDTVINTTRVIECLVTGWIEKEYVQGVKDMENNNVMTDLRDYNLWLSEPKMTGTETTRVEIYFTIQTNMTLQDIIDEDIYELKQESMWMEVKRTGDEHTNRIGFITGPVVERANMGWYEAMMKHRGNIQEGEVEIKRNMVYEGKEKEWCITVYSTQSSTESVDYSLRKLSADNKHHMKYISFKNSNKQDRIAGLQLNKYINVKTKYEWLDDLQVLDEVTFNGKKMTISQILTKAKKNGVLLFKGVEQGSGINGNKVFVYFKQNMTKEAREWIRENYGKRLIVEGKTSYDTSLPKYNAEEEAVNNEIQDYILERLKEVKIEQSDQTPSYSDIVRGYGPRGDGWNGRKSEQKSDYNWSDDDTCKTSNVSQQSPTNSSLESSTLGSKSSVQTKMILDLQASMKVMEENQKKMLDHMKFLEDTIVALSETDEASVEQKRARKVADKIKRKRKKEIKQQKEDDDSIENKRGEKRKGPKLTTLKREGEKVYPTNDQKDQVNQYDKVVEELEISSNE